MINRGVMFHLPKAPSARTGGGHSQVPRPKFAEFCEAHTDHLYGSADWYLHEMPFPITCNIGILQDPGPDNYHMAEGPHPTTCS